MDDVEGSTRAVHSIARRVKAQRSKDKANRLVSALAGAPTRLPPAPKQYSASSIYHSNMPLRYLQTQHQRLELPARGMVLFDYSRGIRSAGGLLSTSPKINRRREIDSPSELHGCRLSAHLDLPLCQSISEFPHFHALLPMLEGPMKDTKPRQRD